MMTRWLVMVFIISPAFLLQGCGVWMIDRGTVIADKPYQTVAGDTQRAELPYEKAEPKLVETKTGQEKTEKEVLFPDRWEVIDDGSIPPGSYPHPKFDADPVWAVDKKKPNSFKAVEEYANKNGFVIFKNEVAFPAEMTSGHKPPKIYLIPQGKYILCKIEKQANGDVILTPVEVASCRNTLTKAHKIRWVPRTKVITKVRVDKEIWMGTERYLDKQVVTERYRDVKTQIDAGAVVLGVIGGAAAGMILGHILWYGSGATTIISGATGPVPCPPGLPGPVPPVP